MDFDGIDELVICTHGGGPRGSNSYDAYELTTNGLVLKEPYNKPACWFAFNEDTRFDTINKCVICSLPESSCQWGEYIYQADENGDLKYIRHISYFSDHENDTQTTDTTEDN